MKVKFSSLALGFVALVAVAVLLIVVRFAVVPPVAPVSDAARVFRELRGLRIDGWEATALPLGATEGEREAVEKVLRFDDALFLRYRRGAEELGVYVAYWGPGKGDLRTVGMHTPDTCWVRAGWEMDSRQADFRGGPAGLLPPGQYRCFTQHGSAQHVAFWHLLHGESVPLWRNGFPAPSFLLKLLGSDIRSLSGEQYFIRISSPRPLVEQWDSAAMREVLAILAETGLKVHST